MASGLLLTHSLLERRSAMHFIQARLFRIYPGLIVAVLITVFLLGSWVTMLDLGTYFRSSTTWQHWVRNLLAFLHLEYSLPGVFATNPGGNAVNGSLWTLRHSVFVLTVGLLVFGVMAPKAMPWIYTIGVAAMLMASAGLKLAWAVVSWHWIEKPASRWRARFYVQRAQRKAVSPQALGS